MLRNSLLLIFACAFYASSAQQRLSGRVMDTVTGQPVPYASIKVLNTSLGATSNELGQFELSILSLPIKLVVSEIAHVRDTISITDKQSITVKLSPASIALPEAKIDTYVETLIRQAYRKLQNQGSRTKYGQAFYRQITQLGGNVSEVQEMIWKAKVNSVGIMGTKLIQGRYAEKKDLIDFKSFSVYTKGIEITDLTTDSTRSKLLISLNPASGHILRLVALNQDGNKRTAEIEFISKSNPSNHGSVVIDELTHQILRFRLQTVVFELKSSNPLIKLKNQVMSFEWLFQPNSTSTSDLSSVKVDYHALMTKPLQKDVAVRVSSLTSFYDMQQTQPPGVVYEPASVKADDLNAIKSIPYDPTIWRDNGSILRTPLEDSIIKSFEQRKFFGTMLSN